MRRHTSLLNTWLQENNELVNKWKRDGGGDIERRDRNPIHLRRCCSEFHKLYRKMQGIPPLADHAYLELFVVYNACVCATAQSQFREVELLLKQALQRALQIAEDNSDPPLFWRGVLKSVRNTALNPCVLYLLCLQWAIWLATCQLETILELKEELSSLCETLCGGVGNDTKIGAMPSENPLLVTDPRRLVELLRICTCIVQSAERLSEGQSSETLADLQSASSLPAPRTLVAYVHFLSGYCLVHMRRPHMALQCYRKALEIDFYCVCALYQSMLIYRQLGNVQAEIQALRLLHSSLMLPSAPDPILPDTHPLYPSLLLCSQSLRNLLSIPSALSVLHTLALKCLRNGRVSEGVEHYLDLLAVLRSEDPDGIRVHADAAPLSRLPEIYLEAGVALLMASRPEDCMVVCDEVISTTLELLPERLVLEEPEDRSKADPRDVSSEGEDKMAMLLWVGAAYLLQGHCHLYLKDWKQAVTHYSRCINLLVKVQYKKKGCQPQIPTSNMVVKQDTNLCILQRLKGLSLAGRGVSFAQTDQLREALRDLLLGLQALPECVGAGLWCGEVLWRLGRRQEAAARWEKTWTLTTQSSVENLPVYLQESQSGPSLDSADLRRKVQELALN